MKKTISGISFLHLERPSIVERNQRRNYLRVSVSFPVAYLVLPPEEEDADENEEIEEEPLIGTAIDIGGGGMALEVQSREGIGIGLEVVLGFSTSGSITYEGIIAKVVNIKTRDTKAPPILCLMFAEIDEKEREGIIRFTVARQRELIKTGRIKR
jgi:c-di-GMP-binding flagellar brake protein YcgR